MSDRELLELAAKASGLKIDKSATNGGGRLNTGFDCMGNAVLDWHNSKRWNPLTDDGDALRLAVKLRLDITFGRFGIYAGKTLEDTCHRVPSYDSEATRRAIVRAAAEIGRAMP